MAALTVCPRARVIAAPGLFALMCALFGATNVAAEAIGSASAPAPTSAPAPSSASFADSFARVLDENGIPGGAWAIVRDGRIVDAGGHGVRRLGVTEPVTADTVFRIASLSKTFAAQIAAMLVEEGHMSWDDGLRDAVPTFRLKRPGQAERITIRDLLGQSTGVVPNAYDNLLEADEPLSRILPQFARLEPMCTTGRCYTYQNILFSMVEPAFNKATGRTYESLLRERLFEPLAMSNTSVGLTAWRGATERATPHIRRDGIWQPTEVTPGYYQVAPAAGINASARDMARWLQAQMGAWPEVVKPVHVDELTHKRVATPRELRRRAWRGLLTDAHYGLGWRIYRLGGEDIVTHSGWVRGFVADMGYSRERRTGLVILLNGETSAMNDISTHFWRQELGIAEAAPDAAATVAGGQ